jgi:pyruvate/2-oxoglutarate/acetoin dehydrogenase E1 component
MLELKYVEAINRALREEMERDGRVCVLGEDVAAGGVFGATAGLRELFGDERVRNTPISESAIVGLAIGAAVTGLRPVVEVMFMDFITQALDQLGNHGAKLHFLSGGQLRVPMVLRTAAGAVEGAGAQHSQSLESWLVHVPGLKVVAPADPADAYGLLKAAIRDENPVVFIEFKQLYGMRGEVPAGGDVVPIGRALVRREGRDASVVAYGPAVWWALGAAERLEREGIRVEVIDLRSLLPWDVETVVGSAQKTHRVVVAHEGVTRGGFGAEVAAVTQKEAFYELEAPVERVGTAFAPIPCAKGLMERVLPGVEAVAQAVRRVMAAT